MIEFPLVLIKAVRYKTDTLVEGERFTKGEGRKDQEAILDVLRPVITGLVQDMIVQEVCLEMLCW